VFLLRCPHLLIDLRSTCRFGGAHLTEFSFDATDILLRDLATFLFFGTNAGLSINALSFLVSTTAGEFLFGFAPALLFDSEGTFSRKSLSLDFRAARSFFSSQTHQLCFQASDLFISWGLSL
jgi:hypothetical protein